MYVCILVHGSDCCKCESHDCNSCISSVWQEREREREREREGRVSVCAWSQCGWTFAHLSLWFVFPMFLCSICECSGPFDNSVNVARSNIPLGYTHRHA